MKVTMASKTGWLLEHGQQDLGKERLPIEGLNALRAENRASGDEHVMKKNDDEVALRTGLRR